MSPLSRWWSRCRLVTSPCVFPFECVVNTERGSIPRLWLEFVSCLYFSLFFFFLSDHRSVIKKASFFAPSHLSYNLTKPAVFKRYLQLCLQTKHERPTSKAAPINTGRTGATGQCWGAGEMSNKRRPSAFSCTVPTLEHRPFNKQQRKQTNLGAGPQCRYTWPQRSSWNTKETERQRKR